MYTYTCCLLDISTIFPAWKNGNHKSISTHCSYNGSLLTWQGLSFVAISKTWADALCTRLDNQTLLIKIILTFLGSSYMYSSFNHNILIFISTVRKGIGSQSLPFCNNTLATAKSFWCSKTLPSPIAPTLDSGYMWYSLWNKSDISSVAASEQWDGLIPVLKIQS